MTNKKILRDASVVTTIILTVIGLIFAVLALPQPEWMNELVTLSMAVLIALGIFAQRGETPIKLTFRTFLDKWGSPVTWGAIISLADFVTKITQAGTQINSIFYWVVLFGEALLIIFGAINDSNVRGALTQKQLSLSNSTAMNMAA